MSGSTDATTVTPAWKKLGLKLKHSNANEPAKGTPAVGQPDRAQQGSMQGKRKLHTASAASDYSSPLSAKKPRRDFSRSSTGDATPQLTRKKSVAFADTPTNKTAAPGSTTARKTPAKPLPKAAKKTGGKSLTPKKQKKAQPTADTRPALEYLRHWVASRDSWKFNKNHQSTLIKAVFESGIPPADVGSFYDYIDDIKGAVRMRLRETALAIRLKDNTDRGAAFPEGTADADGKQEIYEAALAGFLEAQQKAASKKRTFAEIDYVTTAQDADVIIRRLVKRMRAEMVIATLSDGDETDASTTTVRAPLKTAKSPVADAKTNGIAGKRRRKLRTNVDDSDTSSSDSSSDDSDDSDSDSDSDAGTGSDTSSSSSDDSSSEDEDQAEEDMDDDSSSSSSSSSDDDDDSDDEDSDDETEVTSTKGEKASK
ncbi:hypothetical protein V2A60_003819 [Cordyceps javanica]|uniref:Proteasome subunit alpha type 6 n=1 Tax=Cordyceps javanica TaxID=43265 RepID=A0A545VST1_9HYPO|nr:proteasome subunit alpha type 6 [Cordyceps javanica]TQW04773.1 proteasome subunit alpha type 6 [Cordyceps javanica]